MTQQTKAVKDVFSDYKTDSKIVDSKILKVNLFKKANKLEIELLSSSFLDIKDIIGFEEFLKNRFMLQDIQIHINYHESVVMPDIVSSWESIIMYVSNKYPFAKVLIQKSQLRLEDNILKVIISVNGAEFLIKRELDKLIEDIILQIFKKRYKVKIIEEIKQEDVQKIEEKSKLTEKYEIEKAYSQTLASIEEDVGNVCDDTNSEPKVQENIEKEKTPLIFGRSMNIKEPLTKIEEISIDSGKVVLEGEVVRIDIRELKNGKTLVLFDIYDGTSTITCKAFVEQDKLENVILRINEAKGLKVLGNARI